MSYEFLEHTADVKFRAEGSSVEEMFVEAAGALNETIRGDIKILEQVEKGFEISLKDDSSKDYSTEHSGEPDGKDLLGLLYNFLEEFLFLLDSEDFLVAKIKEIEIKDNKLACVVVGDVADNYKFTNDVKAVTYSEMVVKQEGEKWVCEVVLDV